MVFTERSPVNGEMDGIVFHETGLRGVLKDCFNTAKGAARICHSKRMRPSAGLSSLPCSVM
jgi:hypothetical protein